MNIVPGNRYQEFLALREMLVVVQVFARHVVFRNLVSGHLCHIWISRIFDTVYGIRFEGVAFLCQLLHTFGVCNRGVRNLLSSSPLSSGVRPSFHAFLPITLRHVSSLLPLPSSVI